ncbi:MAG: DUF4159 domain-containing protein [Phycisphaeraceae bacterium]|nr:DUF4159 domain-containing protein [Phycisphaeraceae bacterium]
MSIKLIASVLAVFMLTTAGMLSITRAEVASRSNKTEDKDKREIEVGMLSYGNGHGSKCFAAGFLDDVARKTELKVKREFKNVALDSKELFSYPFVVMSGEGDFKLSDKEVEHLRAYIKKGGFILASSGCSSGEWASAFEAAMKQVMPKDYDKKLKALTLDHAVFHTLFDIDNLQTRQATDEKVVIYGIEIEGRLAMIYSPFGLNDTVNAGGNCCCCGGNEIQNARYINADILAYVLTR